MMRRCVCVLFFFIASIGLYAQDVSDNTESEWTSLSQFANQEVFDFEIDFSNSIINAQELEVFIANESRWEEGAHNNIDVYVQPVLAAQSWRVYHFHDTSRLLSEPISAVPVLPATLQPLAFK